MSDDSSTGNPYKNWSQACDKLLNEDLWKSGYRQLNYPMGHAGLGVVMQSGYGDGTYPVYVRKNDEGRVVEARILFDWIDDEDDIEEEVP